MKEIYKVTCRITGKVYVGKTEISTEKRWQQHCTAAFLPSHGDYDFPFHRAIRKYGKENFTIETIDYASTSQELNEKEKYWIKFFNSYNNGYNSSLGGDGHLKYNYDDIVNYYLQNNNSLMDTCKHFHIYDQVVYSALQSKNIDYKKLQSTKERKKYNKKIYCVELNIVFNSMAEIDKYFNKEVHGNIRRCLNGITKRAYGYHWKEIEE
jgi:group I intron endonuclease